MYLFKRTYTCSKKYILSLYNGHSHGVNQQYDSFSLDDIVDMNIIFWDRISKE